MQATIIAAYGRLYLARLDDGSHIECFPRGKKSEVACGDRVELLASSDDQAVIERILPRKTLLHRSVEHREKLIAANVTQLIVVVASEPSFSDELLARSLVAAHAQDIRCLIVLNKCDLTDAAQAARARLQPYRRIGYSVLELTARDSVEALRPHLQSQCSVLVGQSGMGKSTLINALIPDAGAATREISSVLDSGKHTTTHARLYQIDDHSSIIDCPGVQAFGLHHLSFGEIEQGFAEFAAYHGRCRFHDCHHLHEPDCAIRTAADRGEIDARRLELFQQITLKRN